MIYSVLYGHLNKQYVKKGDKVVYGTKIGEMGNTGQVEPKPTPQNPNAGTHLHLAVVEGKKTGTWTLASMVSTNKPSQQQCKYFIEDDIFSTYDKTQITAGWLSYTNHYAYDIIPKNRKHYDLYWNRSFTGTVSAVGYNGGYGNYVIVQYDTRVKTPEKPKEPVYSDKDIKEYKDTISKLTADNRALSNELDVVKANNKTLVAEKNSLNNDLQSTIGKLNKAQDNIDNIQKEKDNQIKQIETLQEKVKEMENSDTYWEDSYWLQNEELKKAYKDYYDLKEKQPKMIFNCQKDGVYRIRLKQNYKLYIKE